GAGARDAPGTTAAIRPCPLAHALALLVILLAGAGTTAAQQPADPRIADLVQAGKVRFALFASQFSKERGTGELRGVRPDLARALASRMGIQAILSERQSPPQVVECLKLGACDMAFLPKDARAAGIGDFSFPLLQSEFTFLVPTGSAIHRASQADQTGIRIAAIRGHASTAALIGTIKQAEVVVEETEQAALDLLRGGRVHAFASTRQSLRKISNQLPGA